MGRYVKKICPNCGYVIQNYKLDNAYGLINIGIPFEVCPQCKTFLIKKGIKEVNMMNSFDYIRIFLRDFVGAVMICFIPTILLYHLFNYLFDLNNNQSIVFVVIVFLTFIGFYTRNYIKQFKKEVIESKNRLKNKDYFKIIEQINKK